MNARDREFEEFVREAWPRLRRAAYLLTHDAHEAEDLVQTALTRSYARWSQVRREGAYSYVHRALVNGYIDSTRRRRPVPVETTGEHPVAADDAIEARSEQVDQLDPRERSILVWRYYLDASDREVADRLGVAPGTVRSTASRALARLRATATTDQEGRHA